MLIICTPLGSASLNEIRRLIFVPDQQSNTTELCLYLLAWDSQPCFVWVKMTTMRSSSNISNIFWRETKQSWESGNHRMERWKSSTDKFSPLWLCWKGNVLDRQFLLLVKFFLCVSFWNQTLFQSFTTYFPFRFCFLIHVLLLSFCAPFHYFLRCSLLS